MKLSHHPGVQFLMASAMAGLAFFLMYQQGIFQYRYKPTELVPVTWVGGRPAGEIVKDFLLVQPLNIQQADVHSRELEEPFCVNLLMANYANRRNRGSFAVRVIAGDERQEKILDASEILDNEYEKICFENLRFGQIYRQPAVLEVAGVDGEPGRSVTAWLSTTSEGERAVVNGQPTDLTLVHTIVLLKDSQSYQYNAYILMLFASLAVGLLLTATRHPETI